MIAVQGSGSIQDQPQDSEQPQDQDLTVSYSPSDESVDEIVYF